MLCHTWKPQRLPTSPPWAGDQPPTVLPPRHASDLIQGPAERTPGSPLCLPPPRGLPSLGAVSLRSRNTPNSRDGPHNSRHRWRGLGPTETTPRPVSFETGISHPPQVSIKGDRLLEKVPEAVGCLALSKDESLLAAGAVWVSWRRCRVGWGTGVRGAQLEWHLWLLAVAHWSHTRSVTSALLQNCLCHRLTGPHIPSKQRCSVRP